MPPKRKLVMQEIKAEQIYDYLVSNEQIFGKNCADLFHAFQEKESYKYLKGIGLHQILSATEWTSTPVEEVQKEARKNYEKIQKVALTLEDEFEKLIKEKLNGAFRETIKEEILKYIGQSHNNEDKNEDDEIVSVMDVDEINLVKDIKVEITESDIEDKEKSNGALPKGSVLDEISLDSLSSVHTSDLSSFDDEISISSVEGSEKRRVSLKFAEEELQRVKESKVLRKANEDKEKNAKKPENNEQTKTQSSDSHVSQTFSPRRSRKPNKKYFSSDVMSPFDIDLGNKAIATSVSVPAEIKDNTPAPRKRGRPRRYTSD